MVIYLSRCCIDNRWMVGHGDPEAMAKGFVLLRFDETYYQNKTLFYNFFS